MHLPWIAEVGQRRQRLATAAKAHALRGAPDLRWYDKCAKASPAAGAAARAPRPHQRPM